MATLGNTGLRAPDDLEKPYYPLEYKPLDKYTPVHPFGPHYLPELDNFQRDAYLEAELTYYLNLDMLLMEDEDDNSERMMELELVNQHIQEQEFDIARKVTAKLRKNADLLIKTPELIREEIRKKFPNTGVAVTAMEREEKLGLHHKYPNIYDNMVTWRDIREREQRNYLQYIRMKETGEYDRMLIASRLNTTVLRDKVEEEEGKSCIPYFIQGFAMGFIGGGAFGLLLTSIIAATPMMAGKYNSD
eukprot:GEZU01007462.1.p1 GENE.GEZU01007462.1~~GEZU01007462.1.p1  ORF type:complete len:246 (-),score=50.31 GEZU01007462.1:31-768(-)